jgi:hypothetical protein
MSSAIWFHEESETLLVGFDQIGVQLAPSLETSTAA